MIISANKIIGGGMDITENGQYTISIDVPRDRPAVTEEKDVTITTNGTTTVAKSEDVDGMSSVTITTNVQPSLEVLSVTTNGTFTPSGDGYSKAIVNVPTPAPKLQSKSTTITTNTTTTISADASYDGLSSVTITTNVAGTSSVKKMTNTDKIIFADAEGFETITINLADYDFSEMTDWSYMFAGLGATNGYYWLNGTLDLSHATKVTNMFQDSTKRMQQGAEGEVHLILPPIDVDWAIDGMVLSDFLVIGSITYPTVTNKKIWLAGYDSWRNDWHTLMYYTSLCDSLFNDAKPNGWKVYDPTANKDVEIYSPMDYYNPGG